MAKFEKTGQSVIEIIETIKSPVKKQDAYTLLALFEKLTGETPLVWCPNIIGFGEYDYIYDSGHSGTSCVVAFSPKQSYFSLYLSQNFPNRAQLLEQLGKHRSGVGCIYINKLADINLTILSEMITTSYQYTQTRENKNGCEC